MVKYVDHLPGDGQKRLAFARLGEVEKVFLMVRLTTCKLLLSVHNVVGLKLLATAIGVKHRASVLPNLVLVSVGKNLKALSQTLQVQTFSVYFVLYLCASQQSNLSSQYLQGRCPHPPHCSPHLQGQLPADGAVDPTVCHQLVLLSDFQYFGGMAGSMVHQHVILN